MLIEEKNTYIFQLICYPALSPQEVVFISCVLF